MSVRDPGEIWEQSEQEGERRLSRSITGLLATGLVGGLDVMLGIVALVVTTGAMEAVMPEATAHLIGSLTFGIGFAFLVIGRSELFTENFMVPISAAIRRHAGGSALLRLWVGTLIGNLLGLAVHFVPASADDLAQLFGGQTGDEVDKFAQCEWSEGPRGLPILAECDNWFAGAILTRHDLGDHVGFLLDPIEAHSGTPFEEFTFHRARRIEPGHEA